MKLRLLLLAPAVSAFSLVPLFGQSAPGTLDETTRLMQEYMVQRAEWIELRQTALAKVAQAADAAAKKRELDKLAEEEKPLLVRLKASASAYRAAKEARRGEQAAAKPAQ